MNKREKIIVSITGIILAVLILLGLTYAYFLTQITGNTNNKSVSVTTADLKLTYGDGNGLISLEKVKPNPTNTPLITKTFTVYNNGNVAVEYGVFLEDLINTFERTQDLELTVTCSSSVTTPTEKTCGGYDNEMLTQNDMLLTNSIDAGETQTYTLTLDYIEAETDQSVDMNKEVSAKVQIYTLNDTVDLAGTVSDATTGDYVVVNSTPKRSEIVNGKYKVVGLVPGEHTISVKHSDDSLSYSKTITIEKGASESINGTTITVLNDTRNVKANVSSDSITLSLIPYDEGTLAYAIINSAKTVANGTTYRTTPLTKPAEEISAYGTGNYVTKNVKEFDTYDRLYLYDSKNYDNKTSTTYNSCANSDIGKYLRSVSGAKEEELFFLKVASCNNGEYVLIISEIMESESTLSTTLDDLGTSYYYRGAIDDNYVNFAGMCWRIVRIEGDGSVKLLLEDSTYECNNASFDGNWSIGNYIIFGYDSNSKADFLNNERGKTYDNKGLAEELEDYQTTLLSKIRTKYSNNSLELNSYLKVDDWCYDYNVEKYTYFDSDYFELENSIGAEYINKYYGASKRLLFDRRPSNICTGTIINKFADNTTNMYVGSLTADEVAFAGGCYDMQNNNYYIKGKYGTGWWLLSPYMWDDAEEYDQVFLVSSGTLTSYFNTEEEHARPAVSLKSGATISGGVGTKANPYVIN